MTTDLNERQARLLREVPPVHVPPDIRVRIAAADAWRHPGYGSTMPVHDDDDNLYLIRVVCVRKNGQEFPIARDRRES